MAPKSPKAGKKKLSKAEKDKLKKEEAERKIREEEEAKVLAEQEAAAQKERDKEEAEERRRLENEERKKRKGQLLELDSIWESNYNTLLSEQRERRKKAKWARYMLCDGSPDPTVQSEINTYMNLWREASDNDIDTALHDSQLTLKLIEELSFVVDDTPPDETSEAEVNQYKSTLVGLHRLLQEKLDLASYDVLLRATELQDSETANLQKVFGNEDITLCSWGNLSKNPRIKSHEFTESGFQFEIPRALTLSDCAVRVLFTKFDHFSSLNPAFQPRPRCKVEETVTAVEEKPSDDGEEKKEGEENEEEEKQKEEGVSREDTEDVDAALGAIEEDQDAEPTEEEEAKPEEAEPMEEDVEMKTPEPQDFEDFDGDEDALDPRAYHILGGVFHVNLLHLPPQPKAVSDWVITQVMDPPNLSRMEYTADVVVPAPQPTEGGKKEDPTKRPPVGVTMSLPSDVYFMEEPQICLWDAEHKQWKLDPFSDQKFDEEKRILSFKTASFGTMALAQDAHSNMPFQSWELRPRGLNHAQLTIIAAIIEVEIQIKNDVCCLSQPADRPELKHLINKWLEPQQLINSMKACGLNVFPACDSNKYVSEQNKNSLTEERLYQQMSLVASAMGFAWSRWNSDVKDETSIVVQGAEQLKDEAIIEDDWKMFLVTKKRTTQLKMTEYDETFSDDHAEGTEFNADLYHMAMEIASETAQERIRQTNHKFVGSVCTMLRRARVVTYS